MKDVQDLACKQCGGLVKHISVGIMECRNHGRLSVADVKFVARATERVPSERAASRDCQHGQLARSCRICELEAENAALQARLDAEQELGRTQMAAISAAALMNSRQSDPPLPKGHQYWTPAYQDTCEAVMREMDWRERAETAERQLAEARAKERERVAAWVEEEYIQLDVRHARQTAAAIRALTDEAKP